MATKTLRTNFATHPWQLWTLLVHADLSLISNNHILSQFPNYFILCSYIESCFKNFLKENQI